MIKEAIEGVTKLTGLSQTKLIIIAVIIAKLGGLYVWHYSEAKEAGFNACRAEYEEAEEKAETEQLKKLKQKIAELEKKQKNSEKAALEASQTIDDFEEKNAGLIDEILELSKRAGACVFSDDFGRLLDNIISEPPKISD